MSADDIDGPVQREPAMNPVQKAVAPLKADAITRAEEYARGVIARAHEKLAANDWDLDRAAPRGNSLHDGPREYIMKNAMHALYARLTLHNWKGSYRPCLEAPPQPRLLIDGIK